MTTCIYILEFDQGTIKVGYSKEPAERLRSHVWQAAKFRIGVVQHWVSSPHVTAVLNEKALIAWCAERAEQVHGEEWFTGLSFDEVRDFATGLVESGGRITAS